ncbi:molecular chaperone [Fructilactobacillus lindneri]|uniref:Molecular chaperone (Small heat shock protein) n=2 Tax=Fructilactobacillus lindneri TaxID=53444 RepID=A0A0R2K202_9LACO|nr:Hsp20/alpha crystallin family protein [Fructilactobacillus lindneri]ANZ57514.1 molecular chaperone [Fructilactobacillus lindneri]ANZ58782.1 molecular chaperone [Fructilactobacillus lindneri]KRN80503.1 molecular chaperone (small heat shock protein) [Fructilactobacillus lindneri DSM 20690 = JCM 11027]POG97790.1 molecular chaperone [Fructilactobacillus lindneri]POG99122.1 molecular chaperone [Fructilactobacillus lindneri]
MAKKELGTNNYGPLDDFFGDLGKSFLSSVAGNNKMKTDVIEHDHDYEVVAELPGFKKKDIELSYEDGILTIHAVHDLDTEVQNDDGHVLNHERRSMDVTRSFELPDVKDNEISANYDGGILRVILPKAPREEGNNNTIPIN